MNEPSRTEPEHLSASPGRSADEQMQDFLLNVEANLMERRIMFCTENRDRLLRGFWIPIVGLLWSIASFRNEPAVMWTGCTIFVIIGIVLGLFAYLEHREIISYRQKITKLKSDRSFIDV